MDLYITDGLIIPETELTFATSRSGGPGGQNVNKVSTRVTVRLDLNASASLTSEQKALIAERLPGRIDSRGVLRVTSQRHRTQLANKVAAVQRLQDLLREALTERSVRRPTRVPASRQRLRVEEKRRRGRVKRGRTTRPDPDE
jgi:ribosome-associated protein